MTSITVPSSATAIEEMGRHPIDQTGAQDVFIVGYPKSGNTWYQNLVSGLVFGCNPAVTSDHVIQELVPDVHSKKFFRRFGDRAFFKSHHLPRREYRHVVYLLRDGRDAMGWHSDDEPELGPRPVIASVSLGPQRRFWLRRREQGVARREVRGLELPHGSLLCMAGETQRHYQHALPRKSAATGPRINLTFRWIDARR